MIIKNFRKPLTANEKWKTSEAAMDRRESEELKSLILNWTLDSNSSETVRARIRLRIFSLQIIGASRERRKGMHKIVIKKKS